MYKKSSTSSKPLSYSSILKCRATRGSSTRPLSTTPLISSPFHFRKLPPIPSGEINPINFIGDDGNADVDIEASSASTRRFVKTNNFIPFAVKNNQNTVIDELKFHNLRRQLRVPPAPKAPLPSRKTYPKTESLNIPHSPAFKSSIKNPYEHRIRELGLQAQDLRKKIAEKVSELKQIELAEKSLIEKSSKGAHQHVYVRCRGDSESSSDSSAKRVRFAPEVNNNNRTDDEKKTKSAMSRRWKELKTIVREFFDKK